VAKLPKPLSTGEERLAFHLRANGINFDREVPLIAGRKYRYDFVLPKFRIAIEVHGAIWQQGAHARGAGLERDYLKGNAAVLAGYCYLQFSTAQVERGLAIETIMKAIGRER
jgi:very-short-patch-repair endonuclease